VQGTVVDPAAGAGTYVSIVDALGVLATDIGPGAVGSGPAESRRAAYGFELQAGFLRGCDLRPRRSFERTGARRETRSATRLSDRTRSATPRCWEETAHCGETYRPID